MSTATHHRGRVAALSRSRQPDDPDLIAARCDLAEATLAARIRQVIAAAPPLGDERRARLAAILRGSPDA